MHGFGRSRDFSPVDSEQESGWMFYSGGCNFCAVKGPRESRFRGDSHGGKPDAIRWFGFPWSRWREAGGDTALAAVCWFWLGSEAVPPTLRVSLAGGLFFVVWGIYYSDRLWDRWRAFEKETVCCVGFGMAMGFPELSPGWEVWLQANEFSLIRLLVCLGFCGVGTAVYYFLRLMNPQWVWGRALSVAVIFWAGTMGVSRAWTGGGVTPVELGVLVVFWANARMCLCGTDRKKSFKESIVIGAMLLAAAVLATSSWAGDQRLVVGVFCSAGVLGVLQVMRGRVDHKVLPALADGALWGPALGAIVFWS